jgi:hypothetical protein
MISPFKGFRHLLTETALSPQLTGFMRVIARFNRPSPSHQKSTLAELDLLVMQAENLDQFLSDKNLIEKYFSALSSYLGRNRLPRKAFNAILAQVRMVSASSPEIAKQLWTPVAPREFEILTAGQTTGRSLNPFLWRLYRANWMNDLATAASRGESLEKMRERALSILLSIGARASAFDHSIQAYPRRKRDFLRSTFYADLQKDSELNQVAALYLYDFINADRNRPFLQLNDADLIIDFLKNLKQNPRQVLPLCFDAPIPRTLFSVIKRLVPNPTDLLRDELLFPVNRIQTARKKWIAESPSRVARYRTTAAHPFHGIWVGILAKDCAGGDPDHLDSLTPERWAIGGLKDAKTFFVERNGRYLGVIRCIPLRKPNDRIYASLDIWCAVLSNPVILAQNSTTPQMPMDRLRATLFDIWFPEFVKMLPSRWAGVMMSKSEIIDNTRVKQMIVESPHFIAGEDLGPHTNFIHLDPQVYRVSRLLRSSCSSELFSGEMLFDAKIRDAGRMTLLKTLPPMILQDAEFCEKTFRKLPRTVQLRAVNYLNFVNRSLVVTAD